MSHELTHNFCFWPDPMYIYDPRVHHKQGCIQQIQTQIIGEGGGPRYQQSQNLQPVLLPTVGHIGPRPCAHQGTKRMIQLLKVCIPSLDCHLELQ